MLYIYNPTKLIQLKTNINDLIIKACLTQKHDNKKHLIAYYSKKISKIKQNYNIYDKKLVTIIKTFKQ